MGDRQTGREWPELGREGLPWGRVDMREAEAGAGGIRPPGRGGREGGLLPVEGQWAPSTERELEGSRAAG